MLELLGPWGGRRKRIARLIGASGFCNPRFTSRFIIQDHRATSLVPAPTIVDSFASGEKCWLARGLTAEDRATANEFVRTQVLPQLEPSGAAAWLSRSAMKIKLADFVGDVAPRFWSWGGLPYDWLVVAQLFDVEERVPDGWRYTGYDITQLATQQGYRRDPPDDRLPAVPPAAHHALADARWAREILTHLLASRS